MTRSYWRGACGAFGMILSAAVLASCGGVQTNPAAQGASALQAPLKASGSGGDLLYVANQAYLSTFSYPKGKASKKVGLTDDELAQSGLCSDTKGNVWVPSYDAATYTSSIEEFSHSGQAGSVFSDPGNTALECSVDPVTGDVAVTDAIVGEFAGELTVYTGDSGKSQTYTDSGLQRYDAVAYDDKGNLFVTGNGPGASAPFVVAELPKGGSSLTNLTIDYQDFDYSSGMIQWDGTDLAISTATSADPYAPLVIYRLQVSGSTAKVVGEVTFEDWVSDDQDNFWIQGGTLIAVPGGSKETLSKEVDFWKYPAGGKPTKSIVTGSDADGITVSVAK
jgi:hypothetical protein